MGRHHDQIESASGGLGNARRRVSCYEDPGIFGDGKLILQEQIELVASHLVMFFSDLPHRSQIELETVVAVGIEYMNQRYLGAGQSRGSLYVRSHGHARGG